MKKYCKFLTTSIILLFLASLFIHNVDRKSKTLDKLISQKSSRKVIEDYLKKNSISYSNNLIKGYDDSDDFWNIYKNVPKNSYWHLNFTLNRNNFGCVIIKKTTIFFDVNGKFLSTQSSEHQKQNFDF